MISFQKPYNEYGTSHTLGEKVMTLKEAITHRIYELCEDRDLNPNSLAIVCGMDRSTVYSVLGEKSKNPEIATIKKICDGLEISLGEFFVYNQSEMLSIITTKNFLTLKDPINSSINQTL